MSLLNLDSIKIIAAQSIGEDIVSNDVAHQLAPDVEYRLREIIQVIKYKNKSQIFKSNNKLRKLLNL